MGRGQQEVVAAGAEEAEQAGMLAGRGAKKTAACKSMQACSVALHQPGLAATFCWREAPPGAPPGEGAPASTARGMPHWLQALRQAKLQGRTGRQVEGEGVSVSQPASQSASRVGRGLGR